MVVTMRRLNCALGAHVFVQFYIHSRVSRYSLLDSPQFQLSEIGIDERETPVVYQLVSIDLESKLERNLQMFCIIRMMESSHFCNVPRKPLKTDAAKPFQIPSVTN